jgi:hypothetical protein
MTEAELCAEAVAWLRDEGFDVHQEVESPGGCIDILAVYPDGRRLWAIEGKRHFSFEVLEQALQRKVCAHHVSVLVPRVSPFHVDVAKRFEIGIIIPTRLGPAPFHIAVPAPTSCGPAADEYLGRRYWRITPSRRARSIATVRQSLCEETRTFGTAGSPSPIRWTWFKAMQREVPRVLKVKGPLTTRALFNELPRHMRTQTLGGFYACLRKGLVPGIVADTGRPMKWQLEG